MAAPQLCQGLNHQPHVHQQWQAAHSQCLAQLRQALQRKLHMLAIALGAVQPFRLQHEQAQHRPGQSRSGGQWRVVGHPQIFLEPYDSTHADTVADFSFRRCTARKCPPQCAASGLRITDTFR